MATAWGTEEVRGVDLKDKRLNRRLAEVLSQLGGRPSASIPSACGGAAETAAAYRLFDNEKVSFDAVLAPHVEATRTRLAAHPEVLLVADTTEIDLTRPGRPVEGAGPLDDGKRRGLFLHPLHAFTPDGAALGTVHTRVWSREAKASRPTADRKHTPIEAKESRRWLDAFEAARETARRTPETRFVYVADSEADIYELLAEGQAATDELGWIVRAGQDRVVRPEDADAAKALENAGIGDAVGRRIRDQVLGEEVRFTESVEIRGREAAVACEGRRRRRSRSARPVEVEARAGCVTLRPPWRHDRRLPEVTVHVVLVREAHPPAGEPPVEWILLTNLPIDTEEQVRAVIAHYKVRWMIEVFFRTLKTGCRVEKLRFEHVDRFLPCLATYLIVTWRTLYVCCLGRAFPEMDCEAIFEPAEWKAVHCVLHGLPAPPTAPSLREMVLMVARLGGYVNRTPGAHPGPQTVWVGLQRTHDMAGCWKRFGPEAERPSADAFDTR